MTEKQFIRYTIQDRVATLVIDHPPVNAFNRQTLRELGEAIDELGRNEEAKVIVITGGGQMAFVAGADIKEFAKILENRDEAAAREMMELGQSVFSKVEASRKPVIAAINGAALGGGLELAMACHIRIAGDRARLGQPEVNLGIIPLWGGTQRLARIVGPAKATEIILTGDPITAQEAKALGLVNMVVPGDAVQRQALGLAKKIATRSAVVVSAALEAIGAGLDASLEEGLAVERLQIEKLLSSEDAAEGVMAFVERRPAVFRDK